MDDSRLEKKLKEYYNKLNNPNIVVGKWIVVDDQEYLLNTKLKIINISDILNYSGEIMILAETKDKFIYIKYNRAFIATKIVDSEYEGIIKNWNLILVNKDFLYGKNAKIELSNKEIMKLLKFKLSRKAIIDLGHFD